MPNPDAPPPEPCDKPFLVQTSGEEVIVKCMRPVGHYDNHVSHFGESILSWPQTEGEKPSQEGI